MILSIIDLKQNIHIAGLIKAIQLDYSEADKNLMNAIRKAPQNTAVGFKQHVSYCILVKLVKKLKEKQT